MKIVKQNDFKQKIDVIIGALLSHDITREHAIKCLSSVVVVPNDADTSQAVENAERTMLSRHHRDAGIDLRKFPSLGLTDQFVEKTGFEELEFQLVFGTEFLPFMTEDVKERWEKMAFDDHAMPIDLANVSCPVDRLRTMDLGKSKAVETWARNERDAVLDNPCSINDR